MKPRVILFTQPDCPPCHIVKLFLTERGVAFEERDITRNATAMRELTQSQIDDYLTENRYAEPGRQTTRETAH